MVDLSSYLPWLSILGACLCFGSFAVPMKWPTVVEARVHPLVYQSYKTGWTFITSLLAIVLISPNPFTAWGIASGFSWVPAGVASVVAVQNVGLACGQAIWQVAIIVSSMFWGFVILHDEAILNWWGTCIALMALVGGVVGMTFSINLKGQLTATPAIPVSAAILSNSPDASEAPPSSPVRSLAEPAACHQADVRLGVAAALFNGVWGGANLVPSHYAPVGGVHFVFSFAAGALIANITLVVVYIMAAKFWWKSPLPSPEFRVMALPGFISGSLWSAGNLCSLYAVNHVGQGIGYSLIQSSVIVAGLWGIFYYREITGRPILYWGVSCTICLAGIMGLALERKS